MNDHVVRLIHTENCHRARLHIEDRCPNNATVCWIHPKKSKNPCLIYIIKKHKSVV